jgi:hypothetical protein
LDLPSNGAKTPPESPLAVDHLSTEAGLHARPKPELAYTLDRADSTWIVHGIDSKKTPPCGGRTINLRAVSLKKSESIA